MNKKNLVAILLAIILIISFFSIFTTQLTVPNTINVWLSNARCSGFDAQNKSILLAFAPIKSNSTEIIFSNNGINSEVGIQDIITLSMSEGIYLWANDSLGVFDFPIVTDNDEYYKSKIYANITNFKVTGTTENSKSSSITTFNIFSLINDNRSYHYVNLNEAENMLGISGNQSYILSIVADVNFSLSLKGSEPNSYFFNETLDFGSIKITCFNGIRRSAFIDFPYKNLSLSINTPIFDSLFN